MSQIRFHIKGAPSTEWIDEVVRHRQAGELTAVTVLGRLRASHPTAAISIERRGDPPASNPVLFRFKIFVSDGQMSVLDEDGTGQRKIQNLTLMSRSFEASEREAVLRDIKEKFPNAQVTEYSALEMK